MTGGSEGIDIHNRRQHWFDLALRSLEWGPEICQQNKKRIKRFITFCRAEGLSIKRQLIYLQKLMVLARLNRAPFEDATRDSITKLMN